MSRRTVPDLAAARLDLQAAAEAVPEHSPAWASLAESEMMLAHYGAAEPAQLLAACREHLARALTLDPDNAIGLSTRGAVRFFFERDIDGAAVDLVRALALLPSHALGMLSLANVCAVRHQPREAAAWMDQALLVDPLDVGINMNLGDHRILGRDYAGGVRALEQALEIAPGHRPSQLRLSWALALSGQHDVAAGLLSEIRPATADDAQWHEYSALTAAAARDHGAALQHYDAVCAIDRSAVPVSAWTMARTAAAARQTDAALAHLETAALNRSSSVPFLMVTPAFDALRPDPRFLALGARLGLPMPP